MKTTTRLWRRPGLEAAFLQGEFADFSYDMHTHETICLSLITKGAIRIRMNGLEMTARAGDLYAINADVPHAGGPVDGKGWALRTVYVDKEQIRGWAGQEPGDDSPSFVFRGPIIQDARLAELFKCLHMAAEFGEDLLAHDQITVDFGSRLLQRHTDVVLASFTPPREESGVQLVKDYLLANVAGRVSLSDLSKISGLPTHRIYRAFEREQGMTPHEFQRQARVRLAAAKIREGEPLSQAAVAAGFVDQAHLTRSFFRHLAVTPGAYRQAVLDPAPS